MSFSDIAKDSEKNYKYIQHLLHEEYKFTEFTPEDLEDLNAFDNCINCGLCLSVCPVVRAVGVTRFPGPRSLGISVPRAFDNLLEMRDILFECTNCNACHEICPQKVPIKQIVLKLKNKLIHMAPEMIHPDVMKLTSSLREVKMFYTPRPLEKKMKIINRQLSKLGLPYIEDKYDANATVLFYTGCKAEERLYMMKEGGKLVLEKLGVHWTLMKNFVCCGFPAEDKGDLEELSFMQNELGKQLKEMKNIRTIVTVCPGCTASIKKTIRRFGLDIEVKHLIRFIVEDIGLEEFKKKINSSAIKEKLVVGVQTPCNLYREGDPWIMEATEKLLENIENVELVHLPTENSCCGGGAFVSVTNKDISNKILKYKTKELEESKAQKLMTMCPECFSQWASGTRIFLKNEKDTIDISVLLAKLLYTK